MINGVGWVKLTTHSQKIPSKNPALLGLRTNNHCNYLKYEQAP